MLRILLIAGLVVAGLVVVVAGTGALLPRTHLATSSVLYPQPPDTVWQVLTGFQEHPSWRSGLQGMQRLPDRNGHAVWREVRASGPLTYEVVEEDPPRRLVTRMADPDLPFGGSWTYVLTPEAGGTRVAITEDGEIKNPIFRFVARFIMGHHATLEEVLRDLGHRLGQEAEPRRG